MLSDQATVALTCMMIDHIPDNVRVSCEEIKKYTRSDQLTVSIIVIDCEHDTRVCRIWSG